MEALHRKWDYDVYCWGQDTVFLVDGFGSMVYCWWWKRNPVNQTSWGWQLINPIVFKFLAPSKRWCRISGHQQYRWYDPSTDFFSPLIWRHTDTNMMVDSQCWLWGINLCMVIWMYTFSTLGIQPPCQMMIGVYIITSSVRYLGSVTILRRWLDPYRATIFPT